MLRAATDAVMFRRARTSATASTPCALSSKFITGRRRQRESSSRGRHGTKPARWLNVDLQKPFRSPTRALLRSNFQ